MRAQLLMRLLLLIMRLLLLPAGPGARPDDHGGHFLRFCSINDHLSPYVEVRDARERGWERDFPLGGDWVRLRPQTGKRAREGHAGPCRGHAGLPQGWGGLHGPPD